MARERTLVRRRAGVLAAAAAALALATATTASAGPLRPTGGSETTGAPTPGVLSVLSELPGLSLLAGTRPRGHDVSSHQRRVDWAAARAKGARFVYVKATESTNYRNPYFSGQYSGAREAGLIRGAYHFARPDRSSGAKQAAYFVRHGGDWRADGWTLPPALD
ncbi:GH25 family lysozyme, partial [Streptomyces flaveolus]